MSSDTTTEETSVFTWTDVYPYNPAWDNQPEPDDNFWPEPRWGRRIAVLVVLAALVAVVTIIYSILSDSGEPVAVNLTATPVCEDGTPIYMMEVTVNNPQGLEIIGEVPFVFTMRNYEGPELTVIIRYLGLDGQELSASDTITMPEMGDPCAVSA